VFYKVILTLVFVLVFEDEFGFLALLAS